MFKVGDILRSKQGLDSNERSWSQETIKITKVSDGYYLFKILKGDGKLSVVGQVSASWLVAYYIKTNLIPKNCKREGRVCNVR